MDLFRRADKWRAGRYGKGILTGILTFLCLLSIAYVSESRGLTDGFGKGIEPVLLAGGIAWLLIHFSRVKERRLKVISGIGGILLAFSYVYGTYLHYVNDLFVSPGQVFLLFVVVLGVSFLTVPLFCLLFEGIQRAGLWWQSRHLSELQSLKSVRFLFLKYWIGIFVCYLPVFLCYWPVNFVYDAKYQLQEVINNAYKIHHPILHTLLMGVTYKLGSRLGSVSVGISFYTLIQMLVLSAAFAYTLWYLYRKGVPRAIRVAAFLIYALFPMNSLFAISATKDVLFAAFFLDFIILLLQLCHDGERITWKKAILLVLAGGLMIMFRRNAMYAVLVSVPFLVWAIRGKRRKLVLALLLIGTILLAGQINSGVLKAVHATNDDSIREAMSVPLQQLARVAGYRREDLEDALYQEMLLYWNEGFASQYNPYLSDPIKDNVNDALLKSNFVNFFKLWAKVGLKFPGEYAEAFLSNTMGYWYMGDTTHYMAVGDGIAVYHTLIGAEEEIIKINLCPPVGWLFDPIFFHVNYNKVPILGFCFRSSTYFWMLLVFALYMIYRRQYSKLLVTSTVFLYYASCFMGPFVALRYVYCVAVCWPLFAELCFSSRRASLSGQASGIIKESGDTRNEP